MAQPDLPMVCGYRLVRWLLVASLVIPSHANASGDAERDWHTSAKSWIQERKSRESSVVLRENKSKETFAFWRRAMFCGQKAGAVDLVSVPPNFEGSSWIESTVAVAGNVPLNAGDRG